MGQKATLEVFEPPITFLTYLTRHGDRPYAIFRSYDEIVAEADYFEDALRLLNELDAVKILSTEAGCTIWRTDPDFCFPVGEVAAIKDKDEARKILQAYRAEAKERRERRCEEYGN